MSRLLACLLLAWAAVPACADISGTTRISCTPTPSGQCRTKYSDGNDGAAAVPLTWQAIPAISITTTQCNAGYSVNLRALYLTEPSPATSTLSAVSGYSTPTGWTLGADGLACAGSTPASALLKVRATRSGITADTAEFLVATVTPPVSDTTAPSIPSDIQGTAGTGKVTVSWQPSSDPCVSGVAGSAVATYDVLKDGAGAQTVTAQTEASRCLTLTNLGSLSPTPTVTPTGSDHLIVAAGTIDGTSSLVPVYSAAVAGFASGSSATYASVKVNGITNTADYAKGGVIVLDALTAGSRFLAAYGMKAGSSTYVQVAVRPTDGAATTFPVSIQTSALPDYIRITESPANTFSVHYTVAGGALTAALSNYSLPISTTKQWGTFCTATTGQSGATATCDLKNFTLSTSSRASYDYITSTAGTFTVKARDGSSNLSAASSGVAVTPDAPADTTPPTRTVQPSGAATSDTAILWNLGTCTDASGIRGYVPYTKTSSGGSRTTQAEQATNSWSQTGLTGSTTYYLDSKCVDNAGNAEASFSSEASAATSASPPSDPTTAPTTTSISTTGVADPTTTLRVIHTTVAGAHHFKIRQKWCSASTYTNLNQFDHTGTTVDITGGIPSQCYDTEVGAANASESVVIWQSSPTTASTAGTSSNAIKWHPGVYIWISTLNKKGDTAAKNNDLAYIDSICSNANIKGVKLVTFWDNLEGDTQGDYSAGFAYVDEYLAHLAACSTPKRLILQVYSYYFGSCTSAQQSNHSLVTVFLPAYIKNTAGWVDYCISGSRYYATALWQQGPMDRLIALSAAYAARYDQHANFEMFQPYEETVQFFGTSATNWSVASSITQLGRLYSALKTQWTHTLVRVPVNYLGNDTDMRGFMDSTITAYNGGKGLIWGGPDTVPEVGHPHDVTSNFVYRGLNSDGTTHAGWADLRLTYPWVAEVQSTELCQTGGFYCASPQANTLTNIRDYGYGTMKAAYWLIYKNDWAGYTEQRYAAQLSMINAGSWTNYPSCPTGWSCNTN